MKKVGYYRPVGRKREGDATLTGHRGSPFFFSKVIILIYKSGSTTLRVSFHSFLNCYFNSE